MTSRSSEKTATHREDSKPQESRASRDGSRDGSEETELESKLMLRGSSGWEGWCRAGECKCGTVNRGSVFELGGQTEGHAPAEVTFLPQHLPQQSQSRVLIKRLVAVAALGALHTGRATSSALTRVNRL